MNDDLEAIESELASLQPVVPSPRIHDRLAAEFATHRPAARRSSWRLRLSLAAALALSASLPVMLMRPNPISIARPHEFSTSPEQAFDPSLPSVWSYHRALTGSSNSLDSLLNQHADASSNDTPLSHTTAFRSFTSANQSAWGEL